MYFISGDVNGLLNLFYLPSNECYFWLCQIIPTVIVWEFSNPRAPVVVTGEHISHLAKALVVTLPRALEGKVDKKKLAKNYNIKHK